jgi:hypothetical protein
MATASTSWHRFPIEEHLHGASLPLQQVAGVCRVHPATQVAPAVREDVHSLHARVAVLPGVLRRGGDQLGRDVSGRSTCHAGARSGKRIVRAPAGTPRLIAGRRPRSQLRARRWPRRRRAGRSSLSRPVTWSASIAFAARRLPKYQTAAKPAKAPLAVKVSSSPSMELSGNGVNSSSVGPAAICAHTIRFVVRTIRAPGFLRAHKYKASLPKRRANASTTRYHVARSSVAARGPTRQIAPYLVMSAAPVSTGARVNVRRPDRGVKARGALQNSDQLFEP